MGFLGTLATFGIGYVAGTATGRQGVEQLPARVRQALPDRLGGAVGAGEGSPSTIDVREIRQVMTAAPESCVRTIGCRTPLADESERYRRRARRGRRGPRRGHHHRPRYGDPGDRGRVGPDDHDHRGVFTRDIATVAPTDTVHRAIELMRARDVRRLPVVESGKAIGIVSLGDISIETTPDSVLADISTASPDR